MRLKFNFFYFIDYFNPVINKCDLADLVITDFPFYSRNNCVMVGGDKGWKIKFYSAPGDMSRVTYSEHYWFNFIYFTALLAFQLDDRKRNDNNI